MEEGQGLPQQVNIPGFFPCLKCQVGVQCVTEFHRKHSFAFQNLFAKLCNPKCHLFSRLRLIAPLSAFILIKWSLLIGFEQGYTYQHSNRHCGAGYIKLYFTLTKLVLRMDLPETSPILKIRRTYKYPPVKHPLFPKILFLTLFVEMCAQTWCDQSQQQQGGSVQK